MIAFLPAELGGFAYPQSEPVHAISPAISPDGNLSLHPHYRAARPLDATLLKTQAGSDAFFTEKYVDQIDAILQEWAAGLLRSRQSVSGIEKVLAPNFSGSSLQPAESHLLRSGSGLEVRRNKFSERATLGQNTFASDFQTVMRGLSKLLTVEFQVTSIDAKGPPASPTADALRTKVRYELVGTGSGFHREQRVGYWELEWTISAGGDFRLRRWRTLDETRSRSAAPMFADISASALGGTASYSDQMLRGVDYWRTVLDGACGIDIYGHNGISLADIDDDGFDDLYVCQPAGLPNRLYRNRGDGTFEDITEHSGLGILDNTACALFADFDNDGKQDVIVVRATGPLLFVNEGGGKFRPRPGAFHFANPPQGTFTGAAVADYDCDGWLDIYFCLYTYYQGTDQYKFPVPYHDAENGPPNFMMKNNRDGTFRDVTEESGLKQNNTRYSFCCGWGDYNQDGWPDLYVVNDFGRKNLYRNNSNGTFTDVAAEAGVEDVGAGMSVCWLDYGRTGGQDLYVADMWTAAGERITTQKIFKNEFPESVRALYRKHAMGNSLFRNETVGGGVFREQTRTAGVSVGRWSWSSDAFDFDHDGILDLYIANGMVSGRSGQDLNSFFWRQVVANSPDRAKPGLEYEQGWSAINELIRADGTWSGFERNIFYANNRDGTFSDVSGAVGLDFIEDGRSFALADFDGDGRQEIFLKNRNGPQLRLLKNVIENLPGSISFRLRGTESNRDAIGAVVSIETELGRQTRMLQAGSGFLAQHSKDVFFGLGEAKGAVRARIRWPSGLVQEFSDLQPGNRIWMEEGSAKLRTEPFKEQTRSSVSVANSAQGETLPSVVETWLLAPVAAPDISLPDLSGGIRTLAALRGKPVLLNFWSAQSANYKKELQTFDQFSARWASQGLQLLTVNVDDPADAEGSRAFARARHLSFPVLRGSDDIAGVYNILYRYLFDRRRDIGLPTSFLIDESGDIVKVYQGPVNPQHVENDAQHIPTTAAARVGLALPFPGVAESFDYGRNYLSYGSNFFQRGYFEQAAASFQRALQDDPSSAEACYGLGSAYLSQQKTAEARASFERATKLNASYPDTLANAWNNLGLLETRAGRADEALVFFKKALQVSPDHSIALNNLGNAYRVVKLWDQAGEAFERALKVNANDPEANYGLGMVFAQAEDTTRAAEYLEKALKARPDYPEALNNLGIVYLRTRRRDEAVAKFEECMRVAPSYDQCYLTLAKVYLVEESPDKAQAVLLELLKQHPGHVQAQSMLAQLPR